MLPCAAAILGLAAVAAPVKREPTFYTPGRIAAGRQNAAAYPWGRQTLQRIRQGEPFSYVIGREYFSADQILAQTDDWLWLLQPDTRIPRVFPVETAATCPVHGTAVRQTNAFYPWMVDPITHPYQIQCPVGHEWYPSNDYAHGDLTSGQFADAGDGFEYQGKRYYPLRDYAHAAYGACVVPGLRSLSQAWLLTGDRRYAHKGCLLLARLAEQYPNYTDRADRLYFARYNGRSPDYSWKTGGMVTDLIWETFCLEATAYAYDALFPCFDEPELLAELRARGLPAGSADDVRGYIEEQLFRPAMDGLLKGDIKGNEGFHQAAALAVALVLDDYSDRHPTSADLVDYAYHGLGHCAWLLINGTLRDGGGHESPGYNQIKLDFIRVQRLMEEIRRRHPERFPLDRYPDLFGERKTLAVFEWFLDLQLLDAFLPSIGDCSNIQPPHRSRPWQHSYVGTQNLFAFERTGDPRYARACTTPDGTPVPGELWEPYPAERLTAALARPESELVRAPRLLDGYGVGILECGQGDHRRAAALNYSALLGHWQADPLMLELWSDWVPYLPDLGYPFTWQYRTQLDANQLATNTVTVDETQAAYPPLPGTGRWLGSRDGVHVVSASYDPYPAHLAGTRSGAAADVDLFERTVVMVEVSPEQFYTVDLFLVRGGTQHDQSWHGPLVTPEPPPLDWHDVPGTLAGVDVPQFAKWTDRWGRPRDDFPSYLTGLRRATLSAPAAWTWKLGLDRGETLRLHLLPVDGPLDVYQGHGRSPARPEDWKLDYVIARHQGGAGLVTRYLTVLDSFTGQPVVDAVRLASADPLRLEVRRGAATDMIELQAPLGPSRGTAPRALGVRVQCGDRDVRLGSLAGEPLETTILAVDYAHDRVTISAAEPLPAPGGYVRNFNDQRTAMYRVKSVQRDGERVTLDLAETALLARGPVVATGDGRLSVGAWLLFARGRGDDDPRKSGLPEFYRGAWLGEGADARQVAGCVADERSAIYTLDPVPAAEMERQYGGKVVSLWQYGVGDRLECVP